MLAVFLVLIIALVVLLAAVNAVLWWGVDSTDGVDSPEWERRRGWRGFGAN